MILGLAFSTAGCWPKHDWRDFRPDCKTMWCGFVATFPAHVQSTSREILLDGALRRLTLHVARVGATSFAIGVVDLPPGEDDAAHAQTTRAALQRALLANIDATTSPERAITLTGADKSAIPATAIEASGRRSEHPLHLVARFALRKGHLVEVVVIGASDALARPAGQEALDTFFTSLRLD